MDIAAKIKEWNKKATEKKKDSDAKKNAENRPAAVSPGNAVKSNIDNLATKTAKMEIDAKEEKSSESAPEVKLEGVKSIYPDLKEIAENRFEATSHQNDVKLDVDDLATKTAKMVIEKKLKEYPDMKEIAENHLPEANSSGNVVKLSIDDLPTSTARMDMEEKLTETSELSPEVKLQNTETMEQIAQTRSLLITLDDVVRLDIGGANYEVAVSDLIKFNGLFKTMLESEDPIPQDDYGYIFIDRSPNYFMLVHNFMKDGKVQLPNHADKVVEIRNEAQYYQLSELDELCKEKLRMLANKDLPKSTAEMEVEKKLTEPSKLMPEVKLEDINAMNLDMIKIAGNAVRLDIDGCGFKTSKTTLTKFNGMFKTMFETKNPIPQDDDGYIFIDRSPKHFRLILNFMRDRQVHLPKNADEVVEIRNEAQYYQLTELEGLCKEKLRELGEVDLRASELSPEVKLQDTKTMDSDMEKIAQTRSLLISPDNIARLNIGGTRYHFAIANLIKRNGMFKTMLESEDPIPQDKYGYIFIDRSPKYFNLIGNFMLYGKAHLPEHADEVEEIRNEAQYYQLSELDELCKEKLRELGYDDLPANIARVEAEEKLTEPSELVPDVKLQDTKTMERIAQTRPISISLNNNIARLNIGGARYHTAVSNLIKYSGMFKTMLETEDPIPHVDYDYILIDRSPKHFELILNFMRDGKAKLPNHADQVEEIQNEAQYYQFPELEELCKKKLRELNNRDLPTSTAIMETEAKLTEPSELVPEVKLEDTNAMDLDMIKIAENVVRLDIGGDRFKTTKTTLTKFNGMFKTMFETEDPIPHNESGYIFIDRSPKHFDLILNFMRDGKAKLPKDADAVEEIQNEAKYYQLAELAKLCKEKLQESAELFNKDIRVLNDPGQLFQVIAQPKKLVLVIYFHFSKGAKIIRPWGFEIQTFLDYYQNKLEIFFVPFENGELLTYSKPSPWTWSLHYKTKYFYNSASKKGDDWSKVINHDIYKFAKENHIKL